MVIISRTLFFFFKILFYYHIDSIHFNFHVEFVGRFSKKRNGISHVAPIQNGSQDEQPSFDLGIDDEIPSNDNLLDREHVVEADFHDIEHPTNHHEDFANLEENNDYAGMHFEAKENDDFVDINYEIENNDQSESDHRSNEYISGNILNYEIKFS